MATTFTPPIDLYEESVEDSAEEHRDEAREREPWRKRPGGNGDRDEPAIEAGQGRLEQVLGW
jgi:hypothetical protein